MKFIIQGSTLFVNGLRSLTCGGQHIAILECARQHRAKHVQMSLAHINELDAGGVGGLVRLYSQLASASIQMEVSDLNRPVAKVMRAVGVDSIFTRHRLHIPPSMAAMPARG